MAVYYNEIDPYAAQWLRNLIAAGHLPAGDVDERSIEEVSPDDLRPYGQCHFFAGIGVWAHALERAGWGDAPVWTGSCPCQPFSAAGKRGGFADKRHLWPVWAELIRERRPAVVLGEQVASKDGLGWLDLVQADLEAAGYASGAADMCAAGVGAPHIRQRLWFVAERVADAASRGQREFGGAVGPGQVRHAYGSGDASGGLADSERRGREGWGEPSPGAGASVAAADNASGRLGIPDGEHTGRDGRASAGAQEGTAVRAERDAPCAPGPDGRLADADSGGSSPRSEAAEAARHGGAPVADGGRDAARPTDGFWRDADWLLCRDGKWRPVEPGTFPLAHGAAARVGRLRAYGNAIVAEAAVAFIESYIETRFSRLLS